MHLTITTTVEHPRYGTLQVTYATDRVARKVKEVIEVYTVDDTFGTRFVAGHKYRPPGVITWVEREVQRQLNEDNRLEDTARDNARYR